MDIGQILKELRLTDPRRPSQKDIARILGTTRITYGKKENGKTTVSIDEALELSRFYDIDIEVFFDPEIAAISIQARSYAADLSSSSKGTPMNDRDLIRDLSRLLVEKEKEIKQLKKELAALKKRLETCISCERGSHCDKTKTH